MLSKTYDPKEVEPAITLMWEQGHFFGPDPDERGPQQRFCIVIPPPNVTGALHLGHALNNTLQDTLIRWHRMRGDNTLWLPGTDHAGIATQAVVEKRLFEEQQKTRHDLGRDELVRRIWQWKDQYEARIINQLKLMGCSCDFARTRFTLDDGCSRAVRETFFKLFRDGYIFRGKRLVNWDCELQTAVADDEVYHENMKGKFYHFRYPLTESGGHLVIATTRPETMLGDTAVAVNPEDSRYRHLVGKTVVLPLMDREIPIIADAWADPELGSGCVKITPGHDPNDYAVWQRHPEIDCINILNPDGTINDNGGKYAGLDRFEARKAVLKDLEELDLVEKIEDHVHDVGHSDRSKTPIEPYLSDQWFMKMDTDLTDQTLDAVRSAAVQFFPARYKNAYLDWLGERRDWCISRQLWWGHRIPVWSLTVELTEADWSEQLLSSGLDHIFYRDGDWKDETRHCVRIVRSETGEVIDAKKELNPVVRSTEGSYTAYVSLTEDGSEIIELLEGFGFKRDSDVLDTWFSSALWPHSTLGWPEETPELAYYYPTSVLITSRDIVTLWVVRMVLTGLYNMGERPFEHVYIHPKILDGRGVTMSKSKGNGVDPIDIIDAFGADTLRYALAAMTTETQDIRMPVEYLCPHCGKLMAQTEKNMFGKDGNPSKVVPCQHCKQQMGTRWADQETQQKLGLSLMVSDKFEAARNFMNKLWNAARFAFINLDASAPQEMSISDLPTEDRWILAELSQVVRNVQSHLSAYRYSRATHAIRDFFWDSFCDWYLELVKYRISEDHSSASARQILGFCLDQTLRLLHPIVPFITERLWQHLNETAPQRGLPGIGDMGIVYDHGVAPKALAVTPYPPATGYPTLDNTEILETFHDLQHATRAVREIRSSVGLSPKQSVDVTLRTSAQRSAHLQHEAHIFRRLAGVGELHIDPSAGRPANSAIRIISDLQIFAHGVVDDAKERPRIEKEIANLDKRIKSSRGRLSNEAYLRSAPPEVVEETRRILADLESQRSVLQDILALLE